MRRAAHGIIICVNFIFSILVLLIIRGVLINNFLKTYYSLCSFCVGRMIDRTVCAARGNVYIFFF